MRLLPRPSTVSLSVWAGLMLCLINPLTAAPQTLQEVSELLQAPVSQANQKQVLEFFKKKYQKEKDLTKGDQKYLIQKTDDGGGYAGWFFKSQPGDQVVIFAEKGRSWPMIELGNTGYFARVERFPNFSSVHYRYDVNGDRLPAGKNSRFGFESYEWKPESVKQPGIPEGKLTKMPAFESKQH